MKYALLFLLTESLIEFNNFILQTTDNDDDDEDNNDDDQHLHRIYYVPIIVLTIEFTFFNIYLLLRERQRQSMSMGGAGRGGDTESEAGSKLWAVSTEPDVGLEFTNREIMTWAKTDVQPTEPPRRPCIILLM